MSKEPLNIKHFVLEGSSPWIVGRNITTKGNIIYTSGDYLQFFANGDEVTEKLDKFDGNSRLRKAEFYHHSFPSRRDALCSLLFSLTANLSWDDIKRVIDHVNEHVCGHSNSHDKSTPLKRNKLWTENYVQYVSQILENCQYFHRVDACSGNRPVPLSKMLREFNNVVAVDYLTL